MKQAKNHALCCPAVIPKGLFYAFVDAVIAFRGSSAFLRGFKHSTLKIFPYFLLHKKATNQREIKVKELFTFRNFIWELTWKVTSNHQLGLPRLFERWLQMNLEHILLSLPRPLQNPIFLGSYRNLAHLMAYHFNNGKLIYRIKEGLYRLAMTKISVELIWRRGSNVLCRRDSHTFSFYDGITLPGHQNPNGTVAKDIVLYLSDPFLAILNSSYRTLPNFDFHASLSLPTSSRLCEILAPSFLESNETVEYFYSTLCEFMPLKRRLYPSCARKQLDPAHKDLVRNGFLKSWQWVRIPGVRHDWKIRYTPASKWQLRSNSTVHALVF